MWYKKRFYFDFFSSFSNTIYCRDYSFPIVDTVIQDYLTMHMWLYFFLYSRLCDDMYVGVFFRLSILFH
jgi:hypothetical protein